jgi:hypothetical protein
MQTIMADESSLKKIKLILISHEYIATVGYVGSADIVIQGDIVMGNADIVIQRDKVMGNVLYNIKNVNNSLVESSFNKAKQDYDDETVKALTKIAEFIEKSGDPAAGALFDIFNQELNKPQPDKYKLKQVWSGIENVLPSIATLPVLSEINASLIARKEEPVDKEMLDIGDRQNKAYDGNLNRSEKIQKYPYAIFPSKIALGDVRLLRIIIKAIKSEPIQAHSISQATGEIQITSKDKKDVPILIFVDPDNPNFEIQGDYQKQVIVPADNEDSEPVVFGLKAKKEGSANIKLEFFQNSEEFR